MDCASALASNSADNGDPGILRGQALPETVLEGRTHRLFCDVLSLALCCWLAAYPSPLPFS